MAFMVHHEGAVRPYQVGEIRRFRFQAKVEPVARIERPSESSSFSAQVAQVAADQNAANRRIEEYRNAATKIPKRERALQAKDMMSSPVESLTPQTSIRNAYEIFQTKRYRHMPVLDQNHLVGILSDRDLLRLAAENAKDTAGDGKEAARKEYVGAVMIHAVLSASPETEVHDVARVLFEERIGCLPIVSGDGSLVGIITRSDILRGVMNRAALELWT